MRTPASADEAVRLAVGLLERGLSGQPRNVHAERDRAARVAALIWRQWAVGPRQWECKHVRWYLEHGTADSAPWTRYRYWLTVERLLYRIGKYDAWRVQLSGPWCTPNPDFSKGDPSVL